MPSEIEPRGQVGQGIDVQIIKTVNGAAFLWNQYLVEYEAENRPQKMIVNWIFAQKVWILSAVLVQALFRDFFANFFI